MKILSIETSCDDTGIAILEADKAGDFKALANIIASQVQIGKKYGGVYPAMAKREHQQNLVPTLVSALREANCLTKLKASKSLRQQKIKTLNKIFERETELYRKTIPFLEKYAKPDIDLISVTNGPGLEPCLWVGINFAKAISYMWGIPVVPVNHIESHILVNTLENPHIQFPAIALVVSGGHTQIVLMKKIGKYEILGETRDDAAGECFDKCAKILGLGYPGGPIISRLASKTRGRPTFPSLPRPMIGTKDYDFSFSGLKTAVLYADRKITNKSKEYKKQMASEVQQAIIDVLLKKTIKAVKDFRAKSLILGGGVSANKELRKQFKEKIGDIDFYVPKPNLSTDNGLMTAITGFYHKNKKIAWQKLEAKANLRIK